MEDVGEEVEEVGETVAIKVQPKQSGLGGRGRVNLGTFTTLQVELAVAARLHIPCHSKLNRINTDLSVRREREQDT